MHDFQVHLSLQNDMESCSQLLSYYNKLQTVVRQLTIDIGKRNKKSIKRFCEV